MLKVKRLASLIAVAVLVLGSLVGNPSTADESADEPSFTAEAKGDSLMIYSTSKKPKVCSVRVIFSYQAGAGRREGTHSCLQRELPVGDHMAYCGVVSEYLVGAQIEGPVMATCN